MEEEDDDDVPPPPWDGTLVETPTRCSRTKNSLDDRVRMSSAILTVAAAGSVGLVAPRAARPRGVVSRREGDGGRNPTGGGGDFSIVNVIVAGGRGEADFGPGDEQDDDDIESSSSSSSSVWSKLSCSFIESTISESAE